MNFDKLNDKLNEAKCERSDEERAKRCRQLLIPAVDYIYEKKGVSKPKNASLLELIDSPTVDAFIDDPDVVNSMHYVRILGMHAQQGRSVRKKEAKLAFENISNIIEFLDAKDKGTFSAYCKPSYMSEASTRKLYVDLYLKEAGWEIVDQDNLPIPAKAGVEIEVQGMPNSEGKGYCDYVLYGMDGKPLAIVEAKRTSISPEKGRHQVNLYAECMEKIYGYKPVMYYTNGYVTRIIDGIYPDRTVAAFHSLKELELMLQRRSRRDISDLRINDEITNRPYQKMAITNICEWLNKKRRRALLVMATGTGKTRTAISLVDILTRNNWVKTVLFLADRTSLVNQAKRNFAKLMPNMPVCELSAGGEKDYNARLMFCTYQTMINYIDGEDKRFTTGRFDLIIIDEAHRSIFNRYGSIFKYFDSFLVGLTATPKDEVDANTYKIFGCEAGVPNFDYTLEEAIKQKYLVGYRAISRASKLLDGGIDYNNLTEDEREQLDEYLGEDPSTSDFTIAGSELFKYLFNKDTCRKVLEELMTEGIRVDNDETIGKTIIFAYNHRHAQMIVDCFHELYPDYPANTCQLVDYSVNYSDNLVIKFGEDPEFRIAVSVDMLDTGVDVPQVLNLVFFKKVYSKIKFVQMIGRGTRLCQNIFGDGKNKTEFLVLDYCRNFEFFNLHPDGKGEKRPLTLSQRRFQIQLDILHELQKLEYQQDQLLKEYYDSCKAFLHGTVLKIKSHANRLQVRESMRYVDKYADLAAWTALSPAMVKEISVHLAPLLDSGLGGHYRSVSFDIRVYLIERALLKTGKAIGVNEHIKTVKSIAKYLIDEKASVKQVSDKAEDLKLVVDDAYWKNADVIELERMRKSLRDLMQFLEGNDNKKFDIDIKDTIEDTEFQPSGTSIDIRSYREKVIDYLNEHLDSEVIRKIQNLEPINRNDLEELERILWYELGTKEEYAKEVNMGNLAAFVRSLVGLSQEAVNKKFGEYLNGNILNFQQQEFVQTIINYVRENGDVEPQDLVNSEPFNNFDVGEIFGVNIPVLIKIINILHESVIANAS